MRAAVSRAVCSAALVWPCVLGGQSLALAKDCVPRQINGDSGSVWWTQRPSAFFDAARPAREAGNWLDVVARIDSTFRARDTVASDQRSMGARIDSLTRQLARHELPDKPPAPVPFEARAYQLFTGATDAIVIDEQMPIERRRALCWAALEMDDLQSAFLVPARKAFVESITRREERWTRFRDNGYQMLPLELILNSHWGLPRPTLEPPNWQWILLHPSAGLELPTASLSTKGSEALLLELFGVVGYVNDHKTFLSGSLAVSTQPNALPAWGPVVHIGRLGHVGYLWHVRTAPGERNGVIAISPNLFNHATELSDEYRKEVAELSERKAACLRAEAACIR